MLTIILLRQIWELKLKYPLSRWEALISRSMHPKKFPTVWNCCKGARQDLKWPLSLVGTYNAFITSLSQSVWRRWATWRWQQKATLRWWTWLRCTWRHGCPWPPCSSSWAGRSAPSRPWSPCMTAKHWHRTHQLHKRQGQFFLICHFPGLYRIFQVVLLSNHTYRSTKRKHKNPNMIKMWILVLGSNYEILIKNY